MKNFINSKIRNFYLPLLVISVVCLVYIFYSAKTPHPITQTPTVPSPTPPLQIHSEQNAINQIKRYQVEFSPELTFSSLPSSLNLYAGSIINEDLNSTIGILIKKFNLKESTVSKNFYTSQNPNVTLLINHARQSFELTVGMPKNLYKNRYSLKQAKLAISTISKQYSFLNNLVLNENLTKYYIIPSNPDDHLVQTTNSAEANLYNFYLSFQLEGYSYYHSASPNSQAQVMVGPGNTLFKIIYLSQPLPQYTNPESKTVLLPHQIKTNLESGLGEVISANLMDLPYQATEIQLVNIYKYEIEYRYNNNTRQIIPYFRFYGTYSTQYNTNSQIQIILPAVEL